MLARYYTVIFKNMLTLYIRICSIMKPKYYLCFFFKYWICYHETTVYSLNFAGRQTVLESGDYLFLNLFILSANEFTKLMFRSKMNQKKNEQQLFFYIYQTRKINQEENIRQEISILNLVYYVIFNVNFISHTSETRFCVRKKHNFNCRLFTPFSSIVDF